MVVKSGEWAVTKVWAVWRDICKVGDECAKRGISGYKSMDSMERYLQSGNRCAKWGMGSYKSMSGMERYLQRGGWVCKVGFGQSESMNKSLQNLSQKI